MGKMPSARGILLDMLIREGLYDTVVIVTRWYGGKHLGGDRFRHVATCVRHWLDHGDIGDTR